MNGEDLPSGEAQSQRIVPEGMGPRARKMGDRILRSAVDAGISADGLALLARSHRMAMRMRRGTDDGFPGLPSEQDPAYLHPGRVVLILLQDAGERDPRVLAVGALAEGRRPELQVRAPVAARILSAEDEAYEWWAALPKPDWGRSDRNVSEPLPDDALLEHLVTAPEPVSRVALADALDQLRHAHLWESERERRRAVELAQNVYAPMAPRVHATLERRLTWWTRRVGRSLERNRATSPADEDE